MARNNTITVELVGDASKLKRALGQSERDLGGFSDKAKKFGKVLAAGLAVGAAAIGGLAVAAFKAGEEFDNAYDKIRVGTGATGDKLKALEDDFKEVVKSVPTDFDKASTAIADINTRLGLTGEPLQDVTEKMLELSRLTETDLTVNIEKVTRSFKDWGIEAEEMPGSLDKLFRASQNTGIEVGKLTDQMVKYGAPLRQMGFDFEDAAALLAKFEQEGVNTEVVMGSLRIALGKMAKEGEPAVETFQRVVEEIKNAGTTSEANLAAIELFGSRAGPDMAAAIREGRFEIDDLVETIESGSETILQAAEDTNDWRESWQLLKNNGLVLFEPVADRVFGMVSNWMDWLVHNGIPIIEDFAEQWGPRLSDAFERTGENVRQWWQNVVKPKLEAFYAAIQDNWPTIEKIFENFGNIIKDVGRIFGSELQNMSSDSEHGTDSIAGDVRNLLIVLERFSAFVAVVTRNVAGSWNFLAGAVKNDTGQMMHGLDQLTNGGYGRFRSRTRETVDYAVQAFRDARDGIVAVTRLLFKFVSGIPNKISGAFRNLPSKMYDIGRKIFTRFTDGIKAAARNIGSSIGSGVSSAVGRIFGDGYGVASRMSTSGYKGMFARVAAAFPGTRLISGLRPGARTATGNRSYHSMGRAVDLPPSMAIFRWIKANFGSRTKELIFSPAGRGQLHNGRPHYYGEPTRGDHWDHVHWAMAQGGIVRRRPGGIMANIGEGRHDEAVIPLPNGWKDGGAIGTTININGPIRVECADAHGLVRELEMMGVRARAS